MKVLHLTSTPAGIGGVERVLISSANRFAQRFEISYCNLFGDPGSACDFPTQLRERGVRYHEIPGHRWVDLPRIVAAVARLIRREGIDLVQSHMPHANIVATLATRAPGSAALLTTRHYDAGDGLGPRGRLARALDLRCARLAARVVAVSDAVKQSMIDVAHIRADRITVVYNGIDLARIDAEPSAMTWPDAWDDDHVIACVAGLREYKGISDLLRAVALVSATRAVRLVVVGDGPDRGLFEAEAQSLGIAGRVLFTGFHPSPAALLRDVALYVQPSRSEAFGVAILEAMAASRAVIGTRVGGIPEIIDEGSTGLLVPPSDPEALASAIATLLNDRETREAMGRSGRRHVETEFSVDQMARGYEHVYDAIASSMSVS